MKMDALVKKLPQKGLWLERVDIPTLSKGQALVKILKTAICGTDVHIYNWDEWSQRTIKTPMIIGHEFVGEIVEINGYSNAFRVGDLVSGEGHIVCGACYNCLNERRHLCPNTRGIGVNIDGIFAQYAVIPLSNLWLCDKSIDKELYSIFDPFGNAVHTALSFNPIGKDILITGAGPIGIMASAIVKFCGAKSVVLTNTSDFRLELASKVVKGIKTLNTRNESLREYAKNSTLKEGFDIGLEMSGSSVAFNDMLENIISGGEIALLGLLSKDTLINWDKVIFGCLNIKGIYGRQIFTTWLQMTALIKAGLDIKNIITHRFNYKDFEKGFALMNEKKCGKIILDWEN